MPVCQPDNQPYPNPNPKPITSEQCIIKNESKISIPKSVYNTLNKTRYKQLQDMLSKCIQDTGLINLILSNIRDIFHFDPGVSVYNAEQGKKQIERKRLEAKQLGTTVYELYGKKYKRKNKNTAEIVVE